MQTHAVGELRILVMDTLPGTIRLDFRGRSNHPTPESALIPFLNELAMRAGAGRATLELHFEALEFFNSATITAIIRFIKQLPSGQALTVVYDPKHPWQKIFFDALWIFERAKPLFKIRTAS